MIMDMIAMMMMIIVMMMIMMMKNDDSDEDNDIDYVDELCDVDEVVKYN